MSEVKTVDLTPSPAAYERMLKTIIATNPNPEEVAWAEEELDKIEPHLNAGHWIKAGERNA